MERLMANILVTSIIVFYIKLLSIAILRDS